VERFRIKHGRLPTSLDELVPEFLNAVPDDPFDGRPLRFISDERGCTVYSIGVDGIDDGGVEDSDRRESDIAFTLPVRTPE
jgi:hypothetical protein